MKKVSQILTIAGALMELSVLADLILKLPERFNNYTKIEWKNSDDVYQDYCYNLDLEGRNTEDIILIIKRHVSPRDALPNTLCLTIHNNVLYYQEYFDKKR